MILKSHILKNNITTLFNLRSESEFEDFLKWLSGISDYVRIPVYATNIPSRLTELFTVIDNNYIALEEETNKKIAELNKIADELNKSTQVVLNEANKDKLLNLNLKEALILFLKYFDKSIEQIDKLSSEQIVELFVFMINELNNTKSQNMIAGTNFRSFADSINEVIFQTDSMGKMVYVNKAWADITGYSEEITYSRHFESFISSLDLNVFKTGLTDLASRKKDYVRFKVRLNSSKNEIIWADLFSRMLFDISGKPTGLYGIISDVTERTAFEDELIRLKNLAEQAVKAKSDFLATMSHEIRTPMNGVIGMTGLLLETNLSAEQKEYVETIKTSGDILLSLINDILDFTKIEFSKVELEKSPLEIRECIEESFELVAPDAVKKHLDLLYMIEHDVPEMILGDISRLKQIILNLVNNAVKFTETGEVLVKVKKISHIDDVVELQFSVKDTGIGIPKEKHELIFQSFTQADASSARKYGGTGLGLAITKRLVELMSGKIWVESNLESGSTFHFTIKNKVPKVVSPKIFLKSSSTPLKNKRILIVDDNETNLQIMSIQCRNWGMIPRSTKDPKEALRWIVHDDPFDIAILDMLMPEMNGLVLAEKIRSYRNQRELPLVLFTSSESVINQSPDNYNIVDAILKKPIRQSQLQNLLIQTLNISENQSTEVKSELSVKDLEKGKDKDGENKHEQTFETMNVSKDSLDDKKESKVIEGKGNIKSEDDLKILVAEDNVINRKLIIKILAQLGYKNTALAGNGLEVIDEMNKDRFDIIFMDVQMPEMDGIEATKHILKGWKLEERPLIFAMTANVLQGDKDKCINAGMDDYLSKPVIIEDVDKIIKKWHDTIRQRKSVLKSAKLESLTVNVDTIKSLNEKVDEKNKSQILELYSKLAPELISSIRAAFRDNNIDDMIKHSSALRSISANIGANKIADICRKIESHDISHNELSALVERMDNIYKITLNEFQKLTL